MRYNPALDGFRAIAVSLVIVGHDVPLDWAPLLRLPYGRMGVVGFFVLSGFLITSILLGYEAEISAGRTTLRRAWATFFMRRTLRIFPLYFGVLFLFAFVFNYTRLREQLLWHVTYTSNIGQALWDVNFGLANHLWSLCVEEQFYLFWPFLIFACPKERQRQLLQGACLVSFATACLWAALNVPGKWAGFFSVGGSSFALSFGALTAWHWREARRGGIVDDRRTIVVAAATLVVVLSVGRWLPGATELLLLDVSWSVLCGYVIVQACRGRWQYLSIPPLVFIGRISYGIYVYHLLLELFHYPLFRWLHIDRQGQPLAVLCVHVAATLLVSAASYYLYEAQFLRLKPRLAPA